MLHTGQIFLNKIWLFQNLKKLEKPNFRYSAYARLTILLFCGYLVFFIKEASRFFRTQLNKTDFSFSPHSGMCRKNLILRQFVSNFLPHFPHFKRGGTRSTRGGNRNISNTVVKQQAHDQN